MQLRRGCRLWWLTLPVLAIDRVLKRLAIAALAPSGVRTAIPGVLSWAYTQNEGAAFSLLSGRSLLLTLLTRPDDPTLLRAGFWLIIGGGLGNLWDRLAYGHVVDFIRLDFVHFAIFNPADVFICCGAALAVISVLLSERKEREHG